MAAGGIVAAAGFVGLSSLTSKSYRREASAQEAAPEWVDGADTIGHAVHVALLPNGKVFYLGGSGWHKAQFQAGTFRAGIWDPVMDTHEELDHPAGEDLFCCGQVPLENGNILLAGGTLMYKSLSPNNLYWGLNATYEFDYQSKQFIKRESMKHGRWYPTMVTLEDGRILTVEGFDEFGFHNLLTEVYNPEPESPTWTISYDPNSGRTYRAGCKGSECTNVPGAPGPQYGGANMGVAPGGIGLYPRMHLMPNGIVAMVGQGATRRTWEPSTGRWRGAGSATSRNYGTSVLLPLQNTPEEKGAILVCGGSATANDPATTSAEIVRPSSSGLSLISTSIGSMQYPRRHGNPVILPNGKIMIFGGNELGTKLETAAYVPELFDPETLDWDTTTPIEAHKYPRGYHSGALLLRDGRVWTMGTSINERSYDVRTEIYRPPYYFATRPEITDAPTVAEYGGTVTIQTPDAGNIKKVSLVKVSSTTHHYNTDQRLIWLLVQDNLTTESSITVKAPINSRLAPAGYYMIHVLDQNGIPSEGRMIQITAAPISPIFYDIPQSSGANVDIMTLRAGGDTRAGVEVLSGSALLDKQLKTWTVYLRKTTSTASGLVTATIRKKFNDEDVTPFTEQIEASTLTTSFQPYVFTLPSPHTIQANDRILIEYSGTNAIRIDVWNIDKLDGGKTRRVKFGSALTYSASNTKDASGTMSSE